MRRLVREKLAMGTAALAFARAHMDLSPGSQSAVDALAAVLKEADTVAAEQQDGMRGSRAATARKEAIMAGLRETHLLHIARAGQAAASELPKLAQEFEFLRIRVPYAAFRTRALSLVAAAETHRELLVKHGFSDETIQGLKDAVAEFDRVAAEGLDARRAHVGATAKLEVLSGQVMEMVGVMDGLNRYRFRNDADRLAEWKSVSRVVDRSPAGRREGPVDAVVPPQVGGDVRPAA